MFHQWRRRVQTYRPVPRVVAQRMEEVTAGVASSTLPETTTVVVHPEPVTTSPPSPDGRDTEVLPPPEAQGTAPPKVRKPKPSSQPEPSIGQAEREAPMGTIELVHGCSKPLVASTPTLDRRKRSLQLCFKLVAVSILMQGSQRRPLVTWKQTIHRRILDLSPQDRRRVRRTKKGCDMTNKKSKIWLPKKEVRRLRLQSLKRKVVKGMKCRVPRE